MKGKILDYNIQSSSGIISGEDGNRYKFSNAEWKSDKLPKVNQIVDFVIDGENAKDIYPETQDIQLLLKNSINFLTEQFTNITNSNTTKKIISQGIQNKLGFILSLFVALSLFLPIIVIPLAGTFSLFDYTMGKVIFVLLLILAFLFYSGMSHKLVKICASVIAIITLFEFYDTFSALKTTGNMLNVLGGNNDINLFRLVKIGTPTIILSTLLLLYVSFRKDYKESIEEKPTD